MDRPEPPGDLSRPPRLPCPQTGVRRVRARQGLPVLRHRADGPAGRRTAGQRSRNRAPFGARRAVASSEEFMSTSTRWTVVVLAVVVALGVGLWTQLDRNES